MWEGWNSACAAELYGVCFAFLCTCSIISCFHVLDYWQETSTSVGKVHFLHELVQSSVHKFLNFELSSQFQKWTNLLFFFFNMLLQAIIFQNYCHSPYRTTDSNYCISFNTETAALTIYCSWTANCGWEMKTAEPLLYAIHVIWMIKDLFWLIVVMFSDFLFTHRPWKAHWVL